MKSLHDLAHSASLLANVDTVALDIKPGKFKPSPSSTPARYVRSNSCALFYWHMNNYAKLCTGFKSLRKVSIIFPAHPMTITDAGTYLRHHKGNFDDSFTNYMLECGLSAFGVVARLDRARTYRANMIGNNEERFLDERDCYIWLAEEGKVLNEVKARGPNFYTVELNRPIGFM